MMSIRINRMLRPCSTLAPARICLFQIKLERKTVLVSGLLGLAQCYVMLLRMRMLGIACCRTELAGVFEKKSSKTSLLDEKHGKGCLSIRQEAEIFVGRTGLCQEEELHHAAHVKLSAEAPGSNMSFLSTGPHTAFASCASSVQEVCEQPVVLPLLQRRLPVQMQHLRKFPISPLPCFHRSHLSASTHRNTPSPEASNKPFEASMEASTLHVRGKEKCTFLYSGYWLKRSVESINSTHHTIIVGGKPVHSDTHCTLEGHVKRPKSHDCTCWKCRRMAPSVYSSLYYVDL